jgi:hypothetical protein
MASHIAERAATEIKETTPVERMINSVGYLPRIVNAGILREVMLVITILCRTKPRIL